MYMSLFVSTNGWRLAILAMADGFIMPSTHQVVRSNVSHTTFDRKSTSWLAPHGEQYEIQNVYTHRLRTHRHTVTQSHINIYIQMFAVNINMMVGWVTTMINDRWSGRFAGIDDTFFYTNFVFRLTSWIRQTCSDFSTEFQYIHIKMYSIRESEILWSMIFKNQINHAGRYTYHTIYTMFNPNAKCEKFAEWEVNKKKCTNPNSLSSW